MTALELLNKAKARTGFPLNEEFAPVTIEECNTIEKSLKALEIIKEKCVGNDNLLLVKETINYKHYLGTAKLGIDNIVNINLEEKDLLTEEEFNILKEVLK